MLTLIIVTGAFVANEANDKDRVLESLKSQYALLAELTSQNSASALEFDDTETAGELLKSLSRDESILAAVILKSDGSPFAEYTKHSTSFKFASSNFDDKGFSVKSDRLTVKRPVNVNGKHEADLLISADLRVLEEKSARFLKIAAVICVITILVNFVLASFLQRLLTNPIRRVVALTKQMNQEYRNLAQTVIAISENDLTQSIELSKSVRLEVNSRDELGTLLRQVDDTLQTKDVIQNAVKKMSENLSRMVVRLRDNASVLASSSTQLSSGSNQIAGAAKNQSAHTSQVSTAVEEMAASVVETSRNAGEATKVATTASESASEGGKIVEETIAGMIRIVKTVKESTKGIEELAKSADEIGVIIGTINDIADQTNLLALNAAIEAARAGDQGRGFAVVADEVRKLAERTTGATDEITKMIKGIQDDSSKAAESMNRGTSEVEQGRELANRAGERLREIVGMNQQVTDMIQQIAVAASEQSSAAEEIARNIEEMSKVAIETANGAAESAAASEHVNKQADEMSELVSLFKI